MSSWRRPRPVSPTEAALFVCTWYFVGGCKPDGEADRHLLRLLFLSPCFPIMLCIPRPLIGWAVFRQANDNHLRSSSRQVVCSAHRTRKHPGVEKPKEGGKLVSFLRINDSLSFVYDTFGPAKSVWHCSTMLGHPAVLLFPAFF